MTTDDIRKILVDNYNLILNTELKQNIMIGRAKHKTLSVIGDENSISSERTRQIEKSVIEQLNALFYHYEKEILDRYFSNDYVFNEKKYSREIGFMDITKYALSKNTDNIRYSPIIDEVYYDNSKLEGILKEFISIERLTISEIQKYKEKALASSPNTEGVIKFVDFRDVLLSNGYKKYDDIYSSKKINLGDAILLLVKKYFPEGLNVGTTMVNNEPVYSEDFLIFENMLKELYNQKANTRKSLVFRIVTVCVLYGNGVFVHPDKIKCDPFVLHKIFDFVRNVECEYFSNLYMMFENDFEPSTNVTDGYKLHGAIKKYMALHPELNDEFSVKRGKIMLKKI